MKHAWKEWNQKCALGLCAPGTQTTLQEFTDRRFRRYLTRYAPSGRVDRMMPTRNDVWHLFETHLVTDSSRRGKSYKKWLFARAASAGALSDASIESSASLLVRSVVRDYLRREHAPADMRSLDRLTEDGGETEITQLLPTALSPADEASWHEQESMASAAATHWLNQLTSRERIALLGKALGLPLSHGSIVSVAGCSKSVLSECYRALIIRMGESTRSTYRDESKESQIRLTMITLNTLTTRVLAWARQNEDLRDLVSREARLA
ncbi:MAG: hypothetical protein O3C57_04560 [Verrucomicrobia bacterium]|nr:hypothetical protein [Verrucomicrobiota bacterium]